MLGVPAGIVAPAWRGLESRGRAMPWRGFATSTAQLTVGLPASRARRRSEGKARRLGYIAAARAGEPPCTGEFRFGDIGRGAVRRKSVRGGDGNAGTTGSVKMDSRLHGNDKLKNLIRPPPAGNGRQ